MYQRFSGMAAAAVLCMALSALSAPAAEAAPLVKVAIGAPAIVASTPGISVTLGRPLRPGPNWVWMDGYWSSDRHGHAVWVKGYWDWRPPARVITVHRAPVVYRHGHHHGTRRVIHRR